MKDSHNSHMFVHRAKAILQSYGGLAEPTVKSQNERAATCMLRARYVIHINQKIVAARSNNQFTILLVRDLARFLGHDSENNLRIWVPTM